MRRLASTQRLRDSDSAASSGSLVSVSGTHLGGHGISKEASTGRSPVNESHARYLSTDTTNVVQATLGDADGGKLLRDLCGDMYIDSSRLEACEPLGQGAFATVRKCCLKPADPTVGSNNATPGLLSRSASCGTRCIAKPVDCKQLVAVKQLKPSVLSNETELLGFIAESNVLRKLSHPGIVEFKGVGAMDASTTFAMRRSMFLVQELMAGGTLKALLVDAYFSPPSEPRHFSHQDALRWALQIAEALEYLHHFSPMIVHRDLKLENILLTSPNPRLADAKLSDFGLCKCIKDVASGVPMAQSTEHLQKLLYEMGFSPPPQMPPSSATYPKDAPQETMSTQHHQQNTEQPAEAAVGGSAQEQQVLPLSAATPATHQPSAAEQMRQDAHSSELPIHGFVPLSSPAPDGSSSCSSADGHCTSDHCTHNSTAAAATGSLAGNGMARCLNRAESGDTTGRTMRDTNSNCTSGIDGLAGQDKEADSRKLLPLQQPESQTQTAGTPELPQVSAVQADPLPVGSRDALADGKPYSWQHPSLRRASHGQVSAFALAAAVPQRPVSPGLRLLASGEAQGRGAGNADGATVTCRSFSGPLVDTVLHGDGASGPPDLATQSMGVLVRQSGSPPQPLPPLPRGSGVAQRLRNIRAVSRDGGVTLDEEEEGLQAAQLNAEVAAKLRVSRTGEGEGLANLPPSPPAITLFPSEEGSDMSSLGHSSHNTIASVVAKMNSRLPRTNRRCSDDSWASLPNVERVSLKESGSMTSATGEGLFPRRSSGRRLNASANNTATSVGSTVRNGRSTIVAGGGKGGSHSIHPAGSANTVGPKHKKPTSKIGGALKAPLSRVSCGLHRSILGTAELDDSIHAADMVYRMTGTTGSLVYMAPEVLRGTFYSEKVDIFSLAVVMYELLSYTPTTALVTGEHMVDRMYHYAEKVAAGFRQELPAMWPQEVRELISDSWAANPMLRPSAAKIAKRLRAMHEGGLLKQWDAADRRAFCMRRRQNRMLQCCGCLTSRPPPIQGPLTV